MFMAMQQAVDDGLTMGEMLQDIPHDAGAIVVYALLLAFVGFIWYGSRGRPGDGHTGGVSRGDRT